MGFRFGLHASLLFTALLSSVAARAEEPAKDYDRAPAEPAYVAPLSQPTQPTYVPQSVALSGPRELPAREGTKVPAGYTPVERTRTGPLIGGAVTFGSLYFFSSLAASVAADNSSSDSLAALYVPGLGPFIQIASTDTSTGKYFLVLDGVGQCAGLALLIYGLASKKTVYVRNDVAVAPILSNTAAGMGLTGTF